MRTELARVQTETQKQSFERNGFEEYSFHANSGCCETCRGKDGKYFKVKDMQPGLNAAPMHPNCRCSVSAYEDSEEYEEWLDYLSKGGSTEEWNRLKNDKSGGKGVSSGNKGKEKSNYPKLEKTIDFNDKTAIMRTLNKFEDAAVKLPYETLCVVTSDGKVWKMDGSSGFVEESLIQSQKGGSSLENAYSYHNHPKNETNFSFSGQDVGFFLEYKEEYSKASDYKYSYVMKRTKDTLSATYDEVMSEFEEIRGREVLEKAFLEDFDMDEDGFHETVNILSKKYGFYYERKLK